MIEPISWRVCVIERTGFTHPVSDHFSHDEAWRECRHRNSAGKGGLYCIMPIYPVAKMKAEKLDEFVQLVQSVRIAQVRHFASRTHSDYKQAVELETQLRSLIDHCKHILKSKPDYQPQPEAKGFFDLVDYWLVKLNEYRQHKQARDEDELVIRERYKQVRDFQSKIDVVVEQYVKYQPSDK